MQQVRSRFDALVSLAYVLQLMWSTWSITCKSLLIAAILVMIVGVMLFASPSHPGLAGPGCGEFCFLSS
ncbi:MAG TPA: hypothetical protein VEL31_06820 [Ktedonobacteraceae bacterium]|nr:hypothetical protein [Ktedonobacteraceae bacterium]